MINKIEALLGTKHIINEDSVKAITDVVLLNGMNGISAHGIALETLKLEKIKPKIYVNIDFPFSQYDTFTRGEILESIIQKYGKMVAGFNFSPIVKNIDNNDGSLVKDLTYLVGKCKNHKKESRFFINFPLFEKEEFIKNTIDWAEQSDVGTIVLGSSNSKVCPPNDSEILIHKLCKSISKPFGYFGNAEDMDQLSRISDLGASAILLPGISIFNLFVK